MTALFNTPFGAFALQRYPARRGERLLPWCGADSLLLEAMHSLQLPSAQTLVVNDEHGALSVPLQPAGLWTDSMLAKIALERNLRANKLGPVTVTWSTRSPPGEPACAVLRVPKQLPYFQFQLDLLARVLPPGATLLAAGMDKHLSPRTAQLLERYIGPTERHRGQRKARLFESVNRGSGARATADTCAYFCELLGDELRALPNVFSRDQLDIGTRFLLQHLDQLEPVDTAIDLACGNGAIGLAAYKLGLAQRVSFCDESAMALASARENSGRIFPGMAENFAFFHGDGLLDYPGEVPRIILCNPPFHHQHAVDEFVGRRLLAQCGRYLHDDGVLCLVANRHLDYGPALRRYFGPVERLAENSKFIIWRARKT